MSYARVFKSGNSQAVRLPKEFRFDAEQVEIFRRGDEVVCDKPANAATIFDALASLPMFAEYGMTPRPSSGRRSMAVRFLLDTNICIYIAKYNPPAVRDRFVRHSSEELAMSVITLGELRHGAEKSNSPKRHYPRSSSWSMPFR